MMVTMCGSICRPHGNDEDVALATSHTQSHFATQFFVAAASQLPNTITPPLASRLRPLLQCL